MNSESSNVFSLGYAYYTGTQGYPLDYQKAFELFTKGTKDGDVNSMLYLALMYINAKGISRDYKKAFQLLGTALSYDEYNSDVYRYLGYLYNNGFGVPKNIAKACDCYVRAVEYSRKKNGRLYFSDCYTAGCLLVSCNRLKAAFPYFEVAATQGNMGEAWHNMGFLYTKGIVPGANANTAFPFYKKAAELGFAQSMYEVGCIYASKGMYSEAKLWLERAVAKGYEPARKQLKLVNVGRFASMF